MHREGNSNSRPMEVENNTETQLEKKDPWEAQWEKWKRWGPAEAIERGIKEGVPAEVVRKFALEELSKMEETRNPASLYHFRRFLWKKVEIVPMSGDELLVLGEQVYQFYLADKNYYSAMLVAEQIYGKKSSEWKRAWKARKAQLGRGKKMEMATTEEIDIQIPLPPSATFADLLRAIDNLRDQDTDDVLAGDIREMDEETIEELGELFGDEEKARKVEILPFFEQRGYNREEVERLLPVKFV